MQIDKHNLKTTEERCQRWYGHVIRMTDKNSRNSNFEVEAKTRGKPG